MRILLGCVMLTFGIAALAGCQVELDPEDFAEELVEELMSNPRYVEYLEDDELMDEMVTKMTEVMLDHPSYQTTPDEDCRTIILMAAVMAGDYTLPSDEDVDTLCAWYLDQPS